MVVVLIGACVNHVRYCRNYITQTMTNTATFIMLRNFILNVNLFKHEKTE
jgi:hypothetical protein